MLILPSRTVLVSNLKGNNQSRSCNGIHITVAGTLAQIYSHITNMFEILNKFLSAANLSIITECELQSTF